MTDDRDQTAGREQLRTALARTVLDTPPCPQDDAVLTPLVEAIERLVAADDPTHVEVRVAPSPHGEVVEVATWDRPLLYRTTLRVLADADRTVRSVRHPTLGLEIVDGTIDAVRSPRHTTSAVAIARYELAPNPTGAADSWDGPGALVEDLRHALMLVVGAGAALPTMRAGLAERIRPRSDADTTDTSVEPLVGLLQLVDAGHLRLLATCGPQDHAARGIAEGVVPVGEPAWWPGTAIAWNDRRLASEPARNHAVTRAIERSPVGPDERWIVLSVRSDPGPFHALFAPDPEAEQLAPRRRLLGACLTPILEREELADGAHESEALLSTAAALPVDEVLRSSTEELHQVLRALRDAERDRTLLVRTRRGPGARGRTVLLGLPQPYLEEALAERVGVAVAAVLRTTRFDLQASSDTRAQTVVRVQAWDVEDERSSDPGLVEELQRAVEHALTGWVARALETLEDRFPTIDRTTLLRAIVPRLPRGYQETVPAEQGAGDLALLAGMLGPDPAPIALALEPAGADRAWISVVRPGAATEPSTIVPVLESFGFRVTDARSFPLCGDGPEVALQRLAVTVPAGLALDDLPPARVRVLLEALQAALQGQLELDAMNALVLTAGITWSDVALIRAYRRLRRQLGTTYTPAYVDRALVDNHTVVAALIDVLHARFDPAHDPTTRSAPRPALDAALSALQRLDHDRILRGLVALVDATLRTNAFRPVDDEHRHTPRTIALKLDPTLIEDVPRPVPYREIFVYSPSIEGVHLRAGAVARGGLRWSDREDDVRTEILDLLRAQVLKNAVIVPSGAKGGFVVKDLPSDPAARPAHVAAAYDQFVGALLEITDDLDGDTVIPPAGVVRHDGDDPYLVVAADRGTATFSDRANAIARTRGFWLDDAFASGGSNGYDHKQLGVTARGAWVAIRRHFAERGLDVQVDPIDVIGIGDMSGDVFGNGLLRSRTVRLVAAFDHRHVVIDPDPDPEATFEARRRLFETPGSTWADLDRTVLSDGAMVVGRDVSRVELTEQVRALLKIEATTMSPPALIRAVLCAPADLLFAGGIGTYVKASHERHEDLGDRANDEVRVDATELRVRVIGEGANLAITPAARLEFARHGGAINQDAVDNAAGVATSDLEVNLKILFRAAEEDGELDRGERDGLLRALADEVVTEALDVVDRQAAGISREVRRRPGHLGPVRAVITDLQQRHDLDPTDEALPDDTELARRDEADAGLSRPEIASLVAWVKRDLSEQLLASSVPDRTSMDRVLRESIVPGARERFPSALGRHRLRRELIATRLANTLVDRLGPTFVRDLADDTGRDDVDVVAAVETARRCIDADAWWTALDELEQEQGPDRVRELEPPVERLIGGLARARLSLPPEPQDGLIESWARTATDLIDHGDDLGSAASRRARDAHARWLIDDLVDPALARRLAAIPLLTWVPDIAATHARLAHEGDGPTPRAVADLLLRSVERFGLDRLEESLAHVVSDTSWTRQQRIGLTEDLRRLARRVTRRAAVLQPQAPADALDGFVELGGTALQQAREAIIAAAGTQEARLDATAVALRRLAAALERIH
ncbi:MAG: NAD-glutamate dehydrogenase [Nitriliruptoraceae bacterium]|nr:NAD-glutamate dehydrogenase [Nitriliruptoraceae bacterium]